MRGCIYECVCVCACMCACMRCACARVCEHARVRALGHTCPAGLMGGHTSVGLASISWSTMDKGGQPGSLWQTRSQKSSFSLYRATASVWRGPWWLIIVRKLISTLTHSKDPETCHFCTAINFIIFISPFFVWPAALEAGLSQQMPEQQVSMPTRQSPKLPCSTLLLV